MVFSLFKRKDPICGMKEEKGKGLEKYGKWFCSDSCANKFWEAIKKMEKKASKSSCCH